MFEQCHEDDPLTASEHTAHPAALEARRLVLAGGTLLSLGGLSGKVATAHAQQPQSCHRHGQPQPLGPLWVRHAAALPLPAASLAVLEPLLDPAAQAVPGGIALAGAQVAQDQPRLLVPLTPPTPQCACHLPPRRRERRPLAAPTHPHLRHQPPQRDEGRTAVGAEVATLV